MKKFLYLTLLIGLSALANDSDELIRMEGVYQVDMVYHSLSGTVLSSLDRLTVFRNGKNGDYTLSLGASEFNLPFIYFNSVKPVVKGDAIIFHTEATLNQQIYGQIEISFDRKTLELKGFFTDSVAEGYKEFSGTPLYNLGRCLYQPTTDDFQFPKFSKLVGIWEDEEGNELILRDYTSGTISAAIKLKIGGLMTYSDGIYIQEKGLLSFLVRGEGGQILSKAAITYRLDENGKPYLKKLTYTAGGLETLKIFHWKSAVLQLPHLAD